MIRSLPPPRPQPAAAPVAAPRTCPQPAWTAQLRGVSQAASPQPAPRTAQPSRSVSQLRQAFQQAASQPPAKTLARPAGKLRLPMPLADSASTRANAAPTPRRDPMALLRQRMTPEALKDFEQKLADTAGKRAPVKTPQQSVAVVQAAPAVMAAPASPVLAATPRPTQPGQIPPPPPPPPPVNAAAPAAGPARVWNKIAAASAADIQQLRDEQSQKLRKEPGSKPSAASPAGNELIKELKERQALREQRMAARAADAQER